MALSLTTKLCFAIAMLTIATSSCKAQSQQSDSVQIVAKAALCFDNKTVIMNCITSAGKLNASNTNSSFCRGPCYGQAMLIVNCIDGIFSNFNFYNAGMMLGVKSVFQVACGKNVTGSSNESLVGTSHGTTLTFPKELAMAAYMSMLLVSVFLL